MGRFFTEKDLPRGRSEYDTGFKDRDWFVGDGSSFVYAFRWFFDDYSYEKATAPVPRIEIRKWFEDNCVGDLLVLDGKYDTKVTEAKWNHSGNMPTYYVDLRFDTESDAIMFKLVWWDRANGAIEEIHEANKS